MSRWQAPFYLCFGYSFLLYIIMQNSFVLFFIFITKENLSSEKREKLSWCWQELANLRIGLICNEVCVGSLTSLRYIVSYVGRREKLLLEYVFIQNLKSSYFGPCWWKPHVWKVWDSVHLWLPLLFTNIVQWMSCRLTKILFCDCYS